MSGRKDQPAIRDLQAMRLPNRPAGQGLRLPGISTMPQHAYWQRRAAYPDTNLSSDFFSSHLRGPHKLNDLLGLGASSRRSALVFPFGLRSRNAFPLPLKHYLTLELSD